MEKKKATPKVKGQRRRGGDERRKRKNFHLRPKKKKKKTTHTSKLAAASEEHCSFETCSVANLGLPDKPAVQKYMDEKRWEKNNKEIKSTNINLI